MGGGLGTPQARLPETHPLIHNETISKLTKPPLPDLGAAVLLKSKRAQGKSFIFLRASSILDPLGYDVAKKCKTNWTDVSKMMNDTI